MKRQRPGMPPMAVQLAVAERQARQGDPPEIVDMIMRAPAKVVRLNFLLALLFGEDGPQAHLDHNPALRIRAYNPRIKDVAARYTPHAHDPEHLIWRTKEAHHIKTNVRGDGAQFPDRVLIKRERKRERRTSETAAKARRPKRKGGKIPQRRNPWPIGRKIRNRPWHS